MRTLARATLLAVAVWLALTGPGLAAKTPDRAGVVGPEELAAFAADPITVLASLGDRSTGSPGAARAADLIQAYFASLSLGQVGRQSFVLPVKDFGECVIETPGQAQRLVARPTNLDVLSVPAAQDGLTGPLLYAAKGEVADFNDKDVAGAIVLMDLDSQKNWINAASLGAKAVVYLDDGGEAATRGFYQDKIELTPVRFPRFWVDRAEASAAFGRLKAAPEGLLAPTVTLKAQGRWRPHLADNVYLYVTGSDPTLAKQVVLTEAFYDSQAFVPGRSPGADEASSLAALLRLAEELKTNPPRRSMLLVATSGHAQALAGMRELMAAFKTKGKDLRQARNEFSARRKEAAGILKALKGVSDQAGLEAALETPGLSQALDTALKDEVDRVTTRLMQLRLTGAAESLAEIEALSARRRTLRQLGWRGGFKNLGSGEAALVLEFLPEVRERSALVEADSSWQLDQVESGRALRHVLDDAEIVTSVSLHLSSHGDGVGAVNDGWLYALKPELNRVQRYAGLSRLLAEAARKLDLPAERVRYMDGLRGNRIRPWRSYFVDNPQLGGEVSALAGVLGVSLATVNDGRFQWGTPHDTPDRVDRENLALQTRLVLGLMEALANGPTVAPENAPRSGFATLNGQARFIRQGELFPDRAAPGSVVLVYQGQSRFLVMAGSDGAFRVHGLADSRHVLEKAVVEAFRFSPVTGEAIWAIDKKQTGKDAYRVRLRRQVTDMNLVMFSCVQSTLFSMIEPRTFRYFTKVELLDARTEAEPARYWFSRLDTLDSTLFTVFLEPGSRYKVILSDSVLARKMILLDATAQRPEGLGYPADSLPTMPWTELNAARDMWRLILPRVKDLEDHGVQNERIREIGAAGLKLLDEARAFKDLRRYDEALASARASWAMAARAYNDVEKTRRDVLMGVLFYIALFAPFAYCLERLIFAFTDIHKRLLGFMGILAGVIAVIYAVHPAFRLIQNPLVVVVAFFIVALAAMVTAIIVFRFEQEMEELQRRSTHVKATEISKLKALAAAFVIGVANLRRRKIRTSLTCATLVILTFTIMSFTSVKSASLESAVRFSDMATYQGVLLKHLGWKTLPIEAENVLSDQVGQGKAAPRAVIESRDRVSPFVTQLRTDTARETVQGVLGLSWDEPAVSGLNRILAAGRWFGENERRAVLLPETMAARLGVSPGTPGRDTVTIWGQPFTVVGMFSPKELDRLTDLDGEPLTPVVFPSETAVALTETEQDAVESGDEARAYQGRYQHVPSDQVVILPYETVMGLGGQLKSLAMTGDLAEGMAGRLADRFGLTIYAGLPEGTFVFQTSDVLSYAGAPNIVIPLVIAMLIVLNTMIGAVFERKKEIGVYTAVGLAPTHVAFLFIAEALAFAVISVVLGYLVAQTAAGIFSGTPVWKGLTANYSSLSGVAAMALVILVVLLSVIYPSKVAADIAIPDVNRSWVLPEAKDGVLRATLPFLMRIEEQARAGGFLVEYYKAHQDVSHGLFSTADVHHEYACPWDAPGAGPHPGQAHEAFRGLASCLSIQARVWLAPFDFGINQRVVIDFLPALWNPGYLEIAVTLSREAGEAGMWKRLNKGFLDDLRKQLLVWRSLDAERQGAYETNVAPGPQAGQNA